MLVRLSQAFTLIELLIVVAIIAILAAIAVPNFLEAQVRSKVSRAKADMRTLATGLEAYKVDNNHYPNDYWSTQRGLVLAPLTTPVAFLTSIPPDAFPLAGRPARYGDPVWNRNYRYHAEQWKDYMLAGFSVTRDMGPVWSLVSYGPDLIDNLGEELLFGERWLDGWRRSSSLYPGQWIYGCLYDPSNGTVSSGDIVRIGP